ncbi:hypothetical protein M2271_001274 [Streptomyces sp. LBL]|nr:hypothetical protein [Streptomyces sp. LBL]
MTHLAARSEMSVRQLYRRRTAAEQRLVAHLALDGREA